jgi:hypothetical protein
MTLFLHCIEWWLIVNLLVVEVALEKIEREERGP